jgi:hypothetical protein
MPRTGRQQRDVLRPPALLEQGVDLVVGDLEGVLGRRLDVGHLRPVAAPGVHPHRGQRRERGQDLPRVAQLRPLTQQAPGEYTRRLLLGR